MVIFLILLDTLNRPSPPAIFFFTHSSVGLLLVHLHAHTLYFDINKTNSLTRKQVFITVYMSFRKSRY